VPFHPAVVTTEEVAVLAEAQIEAVVPVSDLEAALTFYGETLGLRVIERVGEADGRTRVAWIADPDGNLLAVNTG
jgi:catechol 2,3-dioxygenase-like lactoylglutathione lyase family enzyme